MNHRLKDLTNEFSLEEESISLERKKELDEIATLIIEHLKKENSLDIIVVCTHNSRRSQLGEVWINTLANHFEMYNIKAFSGGMEATAFNYRMVNALISSGFNIEEVESKTNPKYVLKDGINENQLMFSKVYDDSMNPQTGFMALMVCDHADENCPIVNGMEYRIPLRYKDPKEFDDTHQESEAYGNKVKEIGREMYYLLSKVNLAL